MIRINLHPIRQIKKIQAGKRQLFIFAGVLLCEIVLLMVFYSYKSGIVDERQREVNRLQGRVDQLKREVGDFDQLKTQRERLMAQRNIINTLQKARTGPVWMMQEMIDILTPGRGPTVNQEEYETLLRRDPNAGYNPRWNASRLWLSSFTEQGGNVKMIGKAKDYDDVAEFSKRIHLSKYFSDEFLERNDQVMDQRLGLKVVQFSLRCRVNY